MPYKYDIGEKVYIVLKNYGYVGTGIVADYATDFGPDMYLIEDVEEVVFVRPKNITSRRNKIKDSLINSFRERRRHVTHADCLLPCNEMELLEKRKLVSISNLVDLVNGD